MSTTTKRIGFTVALLAVALLSAGTGYWFNNQQHRAEQIAYSQMKDQLRDRAFAVIPRGSGGKGFNPITIDVSDGIAIVKLYEFDTECDCYGTVYFGEKASEDTLVVSGCVDKNGKTPRVYGGSQHPAWVSWGSWDRVEKMFADGTISCATSPTGSPDLLFPVHKRGSEVMQAECFEATEFEDQSGNTWLYATVAMVHTMAGEVGMMNYIVDPTTGKVERVKPDYRVWAEVPLSWRPGQDLI